MQQFACVLFDMDTGHADAFHFAVNHDIQIAFAAKRYFCLRDLVCLRQVRIEVVFSVLFAHAVDLAVHCVSHLDRILHNLFIQGRKCSRHTHADRADLAVDFQTERIAAVTVNFGFCIQFSVDFQSNDHFIIFHLFRPPA